MWNDTAPSATLFTLGLDASVNGDEATIAYCFHSVDGFSKMGKYDGNATSLAEGLDGTFVYTGFRPAWVMCKLTSLNGESWLIKDSERSPYNPAESYVYADKTSAAEDGGNSIRHIDFLSNGFKFKGHSSELNEITKEYIYMAFAETPFKYANAR